MSEHFPDAQPLEVAQGAAVIARIEIQLLDNGAVAVRGQITDERFALQMIDTARDTLRRAYARQKIHAGDYAVVPPEDTPIGRLR